jgi:putative cardiolipin synthase
MKTATSILSAFVLGMISVQNTFATSLPAPGTFFATSDVPHKARLHDIGSLSLLERLRMIERAQESIDLEYFIYDRDPSGRVFTQALVDAAQRGIKVRVLLDTFLVKGEIDEFVGHLLKSKGVEVKYYNPSNILRLIKFQYRNHRKSLIIDRQEAITGGRNIADEYFDLKTDFNFMDKDIQIEGPIVETMSQSFDAYWNHQLSEFPKTPKKPFNGASASTVLDEASYFSLEDWSVSVSGYDRLAGKKLKSIAAEYQSFSKKEKAAIHFLSKTEDDAKLRITLEDFDNTIEGGVGPEGVCQKIGFVSDAPGWGRKTWVKQKNTRDYVGSLMSGVQESLMIDSPYFIPDKYTEPVLKKLTDDKKNIDVFTNSLYSTDAVYVNAVFNTVVHKWMKRGVFPYIYNGKVLAELPVLNQEVAKARWGTHSKVFVFDKKTLFVGSYNFDPRSNRHSTELGFYCESEELAQATLEHITLKQKSAHHITSKEKLNEVKFEGIAGNKRILYYVLKPLSLLLKNLL